MFNAWFYYVAPLACSIVFTVLGSLTFRGFLRGDSDKSGKRFGPASACISILGMAVGATVGLLILLTSPTPWKRQDIFNHILRTPSDRIERFVIMPGGANQVRPLTSSPIVIDDAARIRQIAAVLKSGSEMSLNHPHAKWTTRVAMFTRDGTFYFNVEATVSGDSNGTFVSIYSQPAGGFWNLGDVRADGLDNILEDATRAGGHWNYWQIENQ